MHMSIIVVDKLQSPLLFFSPPTFEVDFSAKYTYNTFFYFLDFFNKTITNSSLILQHFVSLNITTISLKHKDVYSLLGTFLIYLLHNLLILQRDLYKPVQPKAITSLKRTGLNQAPLK